MTSDTVFESFSRGVQAEQDVFIYADIFQSIVNIPIELLSGCIVDIIWKYYCFFNILIFFFKMF